MTPSFSLLRRAGRILLRGGWLAALVAWTAASLVFRGLTRHTLGSRARWLQMVCRRALRVLEVRYSATGAAPVGSIIVANHLGYVDVLVLAAMTPVVFVAKREVSGWPVIGWFARMAGTRFIDRERRADVVRVAHELAAPLAEGVNVVLFLEGTSTDGGRVLAFKSSLLEPAVRAAWSVTPAAMRFGVPEGHSATTEVCWWGDMTLGPHLFNLTGLPWIEARVTWGEALRARGDRKTFAAELQMRVVTLLRELEDDERGTPAAAGDRKESGLEPSLRHAPIDKRSARRPTLEAGRILHGVDRARLTGLRNGKRRGIRIIGR